MALNITKQKTTSTQNMEELSESLKSKVITQEEFDLAVTISKTNAIPTGTKLYFPYLAFLAFMKETYLLLGRNVKFNKKDVINNVSLNAFLLTSNKPTNQPSVEIVFNAPLKSLVVINPVDKGIGSNFLSKFEPIGLECINPYTLVSETNISIPNSWMNFNTAIISKTGVEVYLSLFSLQKILSTYEGVISFDFTPVPKDKETRTCNINPAVISTSKTHQDLYSSLVFHGIVSVYGVITSITVKTNLTQMNVTYFTE